MLSFIAQNLSFRKVILLFSLCLGILACTEPKTEQSKISMDVQGHRGCRGLLPENTLPAFAKAIEIGVNTLEMDVVISKDKQVLLSHEPFLSHEICVGPEGEEISEENEREWNLYKMDYEQIKECDCGSKAHKRFPDQEKMAVHKPLLKEVILAAEQ
ncbi:MAG: glycerophosphodiester phosphodiesterase family protein [Bacteroidota bacterium]